MARHEKWMIYHAFHSNAERSGGCLRYLMDCWDLYPRRSLKFLQARLYNLVSGKKVPVFVHTPKTGGTYVRSCFPSAGFVTLNHVLLREDRSDAFVPIGLTGSRFRPAPFHVLFSTVRNPLTFLRSYYHHVSGHGAYHNREHYDYQASTRGFDYLVRSILDRDDVWPSRKFLYPNLFDQEGNLVVSWINRTENLDEDASAFARSLGYGYAPGERKRAAPVQDLDEYFSTELMEVVCTAYEREFGLFGYKENRFTPKDGALVGDVTGRLVRYDYRSDELVIGGGESGGRS